MTDPINTLPIQQFISSVKSADASNAREVKLDTQSAKRLAFTLGEVLARLNGICVRGVKLREPKAVFKTHCVSKSPLITTKGYTITMVF